MLKRIVYSLVLIVSGTFAQAQQQYIDSLENQLADVQNDTLRLILYRSLNDAYTETSPDTAYYYGEKLLKLAQKLKLRLTEIHALGQMGYDLLNMGNYPRSLQTLLSGIALAEDNGIEKNMLPEKYPEVEELYNPPREFEKLRIDNLAKIHQYTGILYGNLNNHEKENFHYQEALKFAQQTGNMRIQAITNLTLGRYYITLKKPDSAWMFAEKAYTQVLQSKYQRYIGSFLLNMARAQAAMGKNKTAIDYFHSAIKASKEYKYYRGVIASHLYLSDLYAKAGLKDSTLIHARYALQSAQDLKAPSLLLRCYTSLAAYYKDANNNDSTVKYQSLIININDSLFNSKQVQQFQNIDFDQQQKQEQIEAAKADYRNKIRMYVLIGALLLFLLIAIIFWRNSLQRKEANKILSAQKLELEAALGTLKATQAQLVQSEKMASLGELTAGIAHEIQNPLNFINNFSEINTEIIQELKAERTKEKDQQNSRAQEELLNDLAQNFEKIAHHGKRADAIVKGMLQHSRSNSGTKEATDINALVDEYVRLAYHGQRAKDNSFNVTLNTEYDKTIGLINIIPQDVGRVILNLITNAFYSVAEKKNQQQENFEPRVCISTKKHHDKVEVSIKDNGNGIPRKLVDKIFQPFFTTKPTGQGTGLGLSLSYDIIKAHGGEIKVQSDEGAGASFIIQLPVS